MIEVNGLVKFYGERKILHDLTFSVRKGRVCGFLGPNGSGKSTTMDILASLLGPTAGSVKICGYDVVTQDRDVKKHIGYLPDNPPLYREMKVKEFVTYVAKLRDLDASQRKKAVERVMEECDVTDVQGRIIDHLSKGYRQRVALCAALIHQPEVLILDEPTEGLDPNQIIYIRNLIKKLAVEKTVILSSHILSEVQAACHEVIIIHNGEIAAKTNLRSEKLKPVSYLYSFNSNTEVALKWFKEQEFVKSADFYQKKHNSILVEFNREFCNKDHKDNISKVTEQIVEQKLPLIGIEEKTVGLEDLFFKTIHQDDTPEELSLAGEKS